MNGFKLYIGYGRFFDKYINIVRFIRFQLCGVEKNCMDRLHRNLVEADHTCCRDIPYMFWRCSIHVVDMFHTWCGDVPYRCGYVPYSCGDNPYRCGDVPYKCGYVPYRCVEMFHTGVEMFHKSVEMFHTVWNASIRITSTL